METMTDYYKKQIVDYISDAFYSAGVKERDKKKLRIRMDIRKAAKAATAVSPEGS